MAFPYYANLKTLIGKNKKFIRFCFVGLTSTLVDIGLLTLFVEIFKWPVIIGNTVSFSSGAANGFLLNKYWTFKNADKKFVRQFSKFLLVTFIGLALNNLIVYLLLELGIWYLIAKIIATVIVVFWNFHGHRRLTFRP